MILLVVFCLIGFLMYCCCVVGAIVDRRMEKIMDKTYKVGKHYKQIIERVKDGKTVKEERWLEYLGKGYFETADGEIIKLENEELLKLEEGIL